MLPADGGTAAGGGVTALGPGARDGEGTGDGASDGERDGLGGMDGEGPGGDGDGLIGGTLCVPGAVLLPTSSSNVPPRSVGCVSKQLITE